MCVNVNKVFELAGVDPYGETADEVYWEVQSHVDNLIYGPQSMNREAAMAAAAAKFFPKTEALVKVAEVKIETKVPAFA